MWPETPSVQACKNRKMNSALGNLAQIVHKNTQVTWIFVEQHNKSNIEFDSRQN